MENLEEKMNHAIRNCMEGEESDMRNISFAARACYNLAAQHYQSEIATLKSNLENREVAIEALVNVLNDAKLQIEYLHGKFKETGSGNAVLGKIDNVLKPHQNV